MTRDRRHLRLVKPPSETTAAFTVAPFHSPPFPVQGLILEEDTWFALSASPEVRETSTHPIRVMTDAWEAKPASPGTVHLRSSNPYRILAVVHDLSEDPTWRIEWIEEALYKALELAGERGLQAVGVEPLGAIHGRYPIADFDRLLERALSAGPTPSTLRVWRIEPGY